MRLWKNSASIIILVQDSITESCHTNYKILLQKRSNQAKFLPNAMVFPGGAVAESDSHNFWIDHFKSFGFDGDSFRKLHNPNYQLTQIFQDESDVIHQHISLRITAIRETFEELGILICKNREQLQNDRLLNAECRLWAPYLTEFDIPHWQEKVHHDPKSFLTLCKELDCYPDIWSLYLWSNWLTPVRPSGSRFDTAFFMVAFEDKPPVFIEENEVADISFATPKETLDANERKEVEIIFPQWYELSRLKHQHDIEKLIKFAAQRSPLGCQLMFPIRQKIGNGILGVLPGDDLYPRIPDLTSSYKLCDGKKSFEELNACADKMHRIVIRENCKKVMILKNYAPSNFQLSPIDGNIPIIPTN